MDFRELFHALKHFIVDMIDIFEKEVVEPAICLFTEVECEKKRKRINRLVEF